MYSVRKRLMIILAVGFAVLIAVTGYYVFDLLNERVTQEFDQALLTKARAFVAMTESEDGQIELDYHAAHMPEYEREEDPEYFQFWLDDGRMLLRSAQLEKSGTDLPFDLEKSGAPYYRDTTLPDGRSGRCVQLAYVPRESKDGDEPKTDDEEHIGEASTTLGVVVVVARDRKSLDSMLGAISSVIVGAGLIAALIAVLLVWRALVTGFRPIHRIADQVEALDAESLGARVALDQTPKELAPIVDQLNALLDRIRAVFERERRFTANVAHELRTPISELRSLAEVGREFPEDRQAVFQFFGDVSDVAEQMEGVIADLLLLARCHAGVEHVELSDVGLADTVASAWKPFAARAEKRGLRFDWDIAPDLVVKSDRSKLGIIFGNVLGNAVNYARPDAEIRCVAVRTGDTFVIDVTNAAARLSADELRSLTEPFWRKDEARSAAEHAGLGLSVVAELATLLGLGVQFDQTADGLFRVRLRGRAQPAARLEKLSSA